MNTGFSVLMRAFVLAEKERLELNIFRMKSAFTIKCLPICYLLGAEIKASSFNRVSSIILGLRLM
jgi:hypothetical protein